jgi:hypothetical protein
MLVQVDLDTLVEMRNTLDIFKDESTKKDAHIRALQQDVDSAYQLLDKVRGELADAKRKLTMAEPLSTYDVVSIFHWFVTHNNVQQYDELYKPMHDHLDANHKIQAIKLVRDVLGISLHSAKAIVDKEDELNG